MAVIGSLSVKLGLVTVEWDQATAKAKAQARELQTSFNNMGKELSGFKNIFGEFAGGLNLMSIGFAALFEKSMSLSKEITDISDAFGISINKVVQLREALEHSGVSVENAGRMISTLYTKISEAQQGMGGADGIINKFQRLGISINDIVKMKPETAFEQITAAIAKVDNQFDRSEYIKAFFGGKGARTFDPTKFVEQMAKVKDEADAQAESIRKLSELDKSLKVDLENLGLAFGELVGKFAGANGLNISIQQFKTALQVIIAAEVVKNVYRLTVAFLELAAAVKEVVIAGEAFSLASGNWKKAIGGLLAIAGGFAAAHYLGAFDDKIKDIKKSMDDTKDSTNATTDSFQANAAKVADINQKLYGAELAQVKLYKEELDYQKKAAQIKLDAYHTDQFTTKEAQIRLKLEQDISKLQEERDKQLAGVQSGEKRALINKAYSERIQLAKDTAQTEIELNNIDRQNQEDFVSGWKQAFTEWEINSKNYGKVGADAFNSMIGTMNSAIDNFVKTGKLNFKSLIAEIIQGILAAEMKMQASKLFGGVNWGGLLGGLGGLFGSGGGAVATAGVNASLGNMYIPSLLTSSHATGGDIYANEPTLVGEKGPEMIIPKNAGTVIPNNQLSTMMGNQPAIVYNGPYINNLSAIDTQSATQFLAQNKTAVWAANQSAQLSLPQTR